MWAHWHHLANTNEILLPSAHSLTPQPKRQIDRSEKFSAYPPDNHSSDDDYWRGGAKFTRQMYVQYVRVWNAEHRR